MGMYAVVEIAGYQYRVQEGTKLDVPKLNRNPKDEVVFDRVLFLEGGGVPSGEARVLGQILRHGRHPKQIALKRKRRGGHRAKRGHRQEYTCLQITKIELTSQGKEEAHGH